MGNGNPLTKWFPEIISQLEKKWNTELSGDDLIQLCKSLNLILAEIRKERKIIPPLFTCSKCGETHRTQHQKISIQAMIKAASRFNLANESDVKSQYCEWMKFRKKNSLNLYGEISNN